MSLISPVALMTSNMPGGIQVPTADILLTVVVYVAIGTTTIVSLWSMADKLRKIK